MDTSNQWRRLLAVLANPHSRRVAAELMLGATLDSTLHDLPPAKRQRLTDALVQSGLIDAQTQTFDADIFRKALDAAAPPKKRGIERFLDGNRIRQYPSGLDERQELLAWVTDHLFTAGEVLSEREVNERLLTHTDDVALLRRYLVDYALVERRSDGTGYTAITPS